MNHASDRVAAYYMYAKDTEGPKPTASVYRLFASAILHQLHECHGQQVVTLHFSVRWSTPSA
jgi:hypothetical protein